MQRRGSMHHSRVEFSGPASVLALALAILGAACAPASRAGGGVTTAPESHVRSPAETLREAGGTNSSQATPAPTFANVSYGPHPRNVLDFWRAATRDSAPVVVFIHGGGFQTGDKSVARRDPLLREFLERGVSFAAINYRFLRDAPIQDILRDAARAIQFIRFRAADWGVDKRRIAAYGGSAGAGTALWLAARDDLADTKQSDPVLRESSRLCAAGLFNPQATYDLLQWERFLGPFREEWLRSPEELAEFYHLKSRADLETPEGQRIRRECDMLQWLSKDDPPVFAACSQRDGPAENRGAYLHHPDHVREIQKRCAAVGVRCVVVLEQAGARRRDARTEWFRFAMERLRRR
jgi:acetyl esterase